MPCNNEGIAVLKRLFDVNRTLARFAGIFLRLFAGLTAGMHQEIAGDADDQVPYLWRHASGGKNPARGIFATGGVPPKVWDLIVRVPGNFLVHTSGQTSKQPEKNSGKAGERAIHVKQSFQDGYPFIIAGHYVAGTLLAGPETVNLWTRSPQDPETLRQPSEALARAIQAYNSTFGVRPKDSHQLWIVECPDLVGCFTSTASNFSRLTSGDQEKPSAEMASQDTAMVDLTGGAPEIAAAAPSLASSWLGYGQNPGFFEQTPPLYALPAFAASRGREAVEGSQARPPIIRRLLRAIPANSAARQPET